MCAASSSLPVPDSPDSSTVTSDRATCVACCTACWNTGPIQSSSALPDQFPVTLVLALQVRPLERVLDDQQHAVARERLLEEVERADPRRLDGVGHRPVPEIITAADRSSHCRTSRSKSMPLPSGSRTSSRYRSAATRFRSARNAVVESNTLTRYPSPSRIKRSDRPMFASSSTMTMCRLRVMTAATL